MCWKTVGPTAVLVLAIPMTVAGRDFSRDEQRPALVVRTYNAYGLSSENLLTARVYVHTIFSDAGIDVLWIDCGRRGSGTAGARTECLQPLGPNEVALRLLSTTTATGKRFVSMGYALVKLEKCPPYLATVFVDLVATRGGRYDSRCCGEP